MTPNSTKTASDVEAARSLGQIAYEAIHRDIATCKPLCSMKWEHLSEESRTRYSNGASAVVDADNEATFEKQYIAMRGKITEQAAEITALTARVAELEVEKAAAEKEIVAFDDWTSRWVRIGGDLVRTLEHQTEEWTRPVRPIVLGASLIDDIRKAVEMPPAIGVHATNSSEIPNSSAHRDQMAVDLNAVNSFARSLGYGQGQLDEDLAGCIAKSFGDLTAQLAAFADERPVDEAWCLANGGEVYNGSSVTWEPSKNIVVVIYLATGLVMISAGVHAMTVMNKASISQLAHLLAGLRGAM